ncbi:XRE family transcriptional regulator [Microbispora rosea]|uniref:Helix-turn-helix domain-containing protein n=1 Tax=Microbispora hainanensis TaxID=568844 RepID=A0ABZ1SUC6_9ACTN|nr:MULTISPECIES: helix-turn-helix transcriptional regulator [Microbispora]
MADDRSAANTTRSLADKIEWLIQNRWPAGNRPPKNNLEAAAAISEATGEELSSTTIWKLRTGRSDNPQLKTLKALARFFGVPIGYFGDDEDAEAMADQVAASSLTGESGLNREALRALVEMSDGGRQLVADFIISAARLERGRGH